MHIFTIPQGTCKTMKCILFYGNDIFKIKFVDVIFVVFTYPVKKVKTRLAYIFLLWQLAKLWLESRKKFFLICICHQSEKNLHNVMVFFYTFNNFIQRRKIILLLSIKTGILFDIVK